MPRKDYVVVRNGKSQSYTPDEFNDPEMQDWLGSTEGVEAYELSEYRKKDQTLDGDSFRVYTPDGKSQDYSREDFEGQEMQDWLKTKRNYRVMRVRPAGPSVDRATAGQRLSGIYDRINEIDTELGSLPQQADIQVASDPRAIQGRSIAAMQQAEQARRNSPDSVRSRELRKEREELIKERSNNPMWKQYWQAMDRGIGESATGVERMQSELDAANPKSAGIYNGIRLSDREGLEAGTLAADRKSNPEYYRDKDALNAANYFYREAKKVASAPSKYGDEKGTENFWRGILDEGFSAISVVGAAESMNNIPLIKAVKKIQHNLGAETDIRELMRNPDSVGFLSDAEKEMLKAFLIRAEVESGRSEDLSKGYQAGKSFAQSLGFMADFMLMGGLGDAAAGKAVGRVVEKAVENATARGVSKTLGTIGADALHGLVKAVAMSPMMPSTYSNILNSIAQLNENGNIDLSTHAIRTAIEDALIENVSETIGAKPLELFGFGMSKALPKDWLTKVGFGTWAKAMTNSGFASVMKKAGYNGFIEEMFEEVTGNALRAIPVVGTDPDALKDFFKGENLLVTAASFAPLAAMGLPMSTMQYAHTSNMLSSSEEDIRRYLAEQGVDSDTVDGIISKAREFETPEKLGDYMSNVFLDLVESGKDPAKAYELVNDYTTNLSTFKVITDMYEGERDIQRTGRILKIDAQLGKENWKHSDEKGNAFVRTLTSEDGKTYYVVGEGEGEIVTMDESGTPFYVKQDNLGQYTDSGEMPINRYLDELEDAEKNAEEAQQMRWEAQTARDRFDQNVSEKRPVEMGTSEAPMVGELLTKIDPNTGAEIPVRQPDGSYVVVTPDGAQNLVSEEELASKWGIQLQPKTQDQKDADRIAEREAAHKRKMVYNRIPRGSEVEATLEGIEEPVKYNFVRAKYNEAEDGLDIVVTDLETGEEVTLPEEAFPDLSMAASEVAETIDPTEEGTQVDDTPRDSKGRPLPMRTAADGTQKVDEQKLWNERPEEWVLYNDGKPNRIVDSKSKVESAIKTISAQNEEAKSMLQQEMMGAMDQDKIDEYEKVISDNNSLLSRYDGILKDIESRENAAKEAAKAAKEQVQDQAYGPVIRTIETKKGPAEVRTEVTEKDGVRTTRVVTLRDGREIMSTQAIPLPDQYKIKEGQEFADDSEVLGITELRESQDGRAAATFLVRLSNGSVTQLNAPLERVSQEEAHAEQEFTPEEKEERRRVPLRERAKEWVSKTGVDVALLESVDEVENQEARNAISKGEPVKGWFDKSTGKVYLYMPGLEDEVDVDKTYIHEVISHKGLQDMLGAFYPALLDNVWNDVMSDADRKRFTNYIKKTNPSASGDALRRAAADEYIADLSEHLDIEENKTAWEKFVMAVRSFLIKMVTGGIRVTNKDLSELLQASMARYRDIVMNGEATPLMRRKARAEMAKFSEEVNKPTGQKEAGVGSEVRFSITQEDNLKKAAEAFHKKLAEKPLTEEELRAGNDAIDWMVAYMRPYLDLAKDGKRYMPEEVFGKEWSTIFENGSYGRTMENTLLCMRTLAYNDFVNAVQEKIGRPLTVTESFLASQMLYDIATDPQCLYCYVALDRKAYNAFLKTYIEQRDAVLDKYKADDSIDKSYRLPEQSKSKKERTKLPDDNPVNKLYNEYLNGREDSPVQRQRFNSWLDDVADGTLIKMSDLTSPEKRQKVALQGESYARQIEDAERYAQAASWAKKQEEYRAYNGELLKMPQSVVDMLNSEYGLRFYSFSEYTPAFIVENMQMVRDAALRNLVGLAYTKEVDFAKIFAPTGVNINISVYGREAEDGTVVMDTKQGADWTEASALREKYGNVGVVFVATNDKMVEWAINQPWIDCVIPFHIVRTGENVAAFYDWTNYTSMEGEKDSAKHTKYLLPTEHKNDKATFLALCEERGLKPRFADLILPSTGRSVVESPNYMKLVNETRRSVEETERIKPVFDLDAARESFDRFVEKGGYYGGWFVEEGAFEKGVDQVASDVLAGKTAKEVDYGRQDIKMSADKLAEMATKRMRPRTHQGTPLTAAEKQRGEKALGDILAAIGKNAEGKEGGMTDEAKARKAEYEKEKEEVDSLSFRITYHGTGADFERFDHSHMGEGEGNQSYGWGTYVTTNKDTGLAYARAVGGSDDQYERAVRSIENQIATDENRLKKAKTDEEKKAINDDIALMEQRKKEMQRHLYTVEIPDDNGENYLHWNEPITMNQSRKIMDAVRARVGDEWGSELDYELRSALGYGTYGKHVEGGLDYFLGNEYNYSTGENPGAERNSKLLRSLGIIGMEHPAKGVNGEELEGEPNYVIYDEKDIKITDHLRFSRITPEQDKEYLDAVERGDMEKAQRMVDEAAEAAGYTIRGYHGTTHDFTVFDRSRGNAEGNWGKGFYFTNNLDDADANYGNEDGPDLQAKIERLAENMEWMDGYEDMDYDERKVEAAKMLTGDNPHVISAAIRMNNPVVFNSRAVGPRETFFDFDSGYNPETDEYEGEESGLLLDFIDAWNDVLLDFDYQNVSPNEILEYADGDGLTASQLEQKAREILDNIGGIMTPEGDYVSGEFLRAVFERMGFDGIVDHNVNIKFGTQRKLGRSMDGMDTDTVHVVAFQPNQIKQSDPVTYDDNGKVIPLSERFNPQSSDIRFRRVEDPAKVEELESGEKELGYRNVVMNEDGTLGSPMAGRLGKKGEKSVSTSGFAFNEWEEAEENPNMATEDGKINLIKPGGKGSVDGVDYNPYIHIRPTTVNKQFTQAWKRPELVYVETAYPTSELTSGYKADKAKLSVGRHAWNGGELILSRYDKPMRVVPWDEVADAWEKEFGNGVTFDIVPPALLPILDERGVKILAPKKAAGDAAMQAYKDWRKENPTEAQKKAIEFVTGEKPEDNGIRFSIRGIEGAKNAEDAVALANLDTAEEMEKEGKDNRTIWLATGWERGADGKWRSEIPDAKIKEDVGLTRTNWADRIIEAPELFESYPQLKEMPINFMDLPEGTRGQYSLQYRTIVMNTKDTTRKDEESGKYYLTEKGLSVLLHELQHAIQHIEGFAPGGSYFGLASEYYQKARKEDAALADYARIIASNPRNTQKTLVELGPERVVRDGEAAKQRMKSDSARAVIDGIINRVKDMPASEYKKFVKDAKRIAKEAEEEAQKYLRLAGEVEARNVQTRNYMSEELRKEIPLSASEGVDRKDQVVRMEEANAQQKQPVREEMDQEMARLEEPEIMFRLSNNNRATIESWLKKRTDISDEQREAVVEYIDRLDDAKLQLAAGRWYANGVIRLPEDMDKVKQAVSVAGKAKVDPLQYDNPMSLLEAHANFKPTAEKINPDTVSTLHKAAEYPDGVVVYDVDEGEESRKNMRQIINTHFGEDASPWCLLQGDGKGNLTKDSKKYWNHYNAYPKQAAFKDGKLLAFSANDSGTKVWWDRQDTSHYGIPITKKIDGDELGRSAVHVLQYEAIMKKDALERDLAHKYNCPPYRLRELASPEDIARLDEVNREIAAQTEAGSMTFQKEGGSHLFRGNRQNGVYEEWSADGETLLERTHYKDGKQNGICEEWYPNGQQYKRAEMKDDGFAGDFEAWFDNGNQWIKAHFNKDHNRDGESIAWWKNGELSRKTTYKDGEIVGEDYFYGEDGRPSRINRYDDNGELVGFDEYRRSGIIERTTYTENGAVKEVLSARQPVMFRISNANQRIFISNAENALGKIKMEKATPEQWKKMLEKEGGLKAAEDKWLGLSQWLDAQTKKTLTKDEVGQFIAENQIQIEETHYAEDVVDDDAKALESYQDEFDKFREEKLEEIAGIREINIRDNATASQYAWEQMIERYGDDFEMAFSLSGDSLEPYYDDFRGGLGDAAKYFLDQRRGGTAERIQFTRLHYTTEGLTNRQEIALTVPTIESWNESDDVHFGDAGEGRAISWARFGDTWTSKDRDEAEKKYREADKAFRDYRNEIVNKYALQATDTKKVKDLATEEENAKVKELQLEASRLYKEWMYGQHQREKVLVIDEIQSKRHQEAREQGGYKDDAALKKAQARSEAAKKAYDDYMDSLIEKYGDFNEMHDKITPEENAESQRLYRELSDAEKAVARNGFEPMEDETYRKLREEQYAFEHSGEFKQLMDDWMKAEGYEARQAINEKLKPFQKANREYIEAMETRETELADEFNATHKSQIPAAPFERNWPELTMKRMLRYAAEFGYDTVAWTTGEQQADRYSLSTVVDRIETVQHHDGTGERDVYLDMAGNREIELHVDRDGNVMSVGNRQDEQFVGNNLGNIIGKELAVKVMSTKTDKVGNSEVVAEGDQLKVGGEGMKGFYDDILPRFMNKYGKKWGVKVEDIFLPALGEDASAGAQKGLTMHSVKVTPEMKESVMEGQLMFRMAPNGKESNLTDEQWELVRTPQFKKWFGDWESAALIRQAQNAIENKNSKSKYVFVPSDRLLKRFTELLGHNVDTVVITDDAIRHIINHHGSGEVQRGQADMTPEDIATIPYVMNNWDYMELNPQFDDKKGNVAIEIRKKINGVSVVGTISRGKDKEFVVTSWKYVESGEKSDALDASTETPGLYVRNDSDIANVKKDLEIIKSSLKNSSKVVDENGEPLVMYHGTPYGGFNEFSNSVNYFTKSEQYAESYIDDKVDPEYADEARRKVYNVFLNIENPMVFSEGYAESVADKNIYSGHIGDILQSDEVRQAIIDAGYDGAIDREGGSEMTVAFYPNQIKSATNNNGDFDPANPDIRFRITPEFSTAADLVERYENQDGEEYPWMSQGELISAVENNIERDDATDHLFELLDRYHDLEEEYFAEGKRDFAGGEMDDLFNEILDELRNLEPVETEEAETKFKIGEPVVIPGPTAEELITKVQNSGLPGILEKDEVDDYFRTAFTLMPESDRKAAAQDAIDKDLNFRRPVRDYIASLAAKGYANDETGFLRAMANRLEQLISTDQPISENQLLYMMWRDAKRYPKQDVLSLAQDISLRKRLGIGEFVNQFPGQAEAVERQAEKDVDVADKARSEDRKAAIREVKEGKAPYEAINRAMGAQRQYDRATVDGVVDLAKQMIKEGNINGVTAREMARLLTIIKSTNGRRPETVKNCCKQLMDFMVDHTLQTEEDLLAKMLKVKTAKVKEPGVDVQAKLDVRAQGIINTFKEYMGRDESDIREAIDGHMDKISDDRTSETRKEELQAELDGLSLALQYCTEIAQNEAENTGIRDGLKAARADFKDLPEEEQKRFAKALQEQTEASYDMIRKNKIDRVNAYRELRAALGEAIAEGAERAKSFLEKERERVAQIHHEANSDMQGVDDDPIEPKVKGIGKLINNGVARLLTSPLATFDQMLRMLGRKHPNGQGYLWNRYMGQLRDANDNEKLGLDKANDELNAKVQEIYGDKTMTWNDLYNLERGMGKATIRFFIANGKWVEQELSAGNLLYIYMVDKMPDGRMKLRQMGINEDDVRAIRDGLDPRFIRLADWIQEEFLTKLRDKYNQVHQRLFGTSMAAIENYFPLRILGGVIREEIDLSNPDSNVLPSAMTGSIIKRTVNRKQLDITGTDAFSLVIEHIQEMEHWAAFAELNRDLGTLLSYKRFQNQMKHMTTIYGAGRELWGRFKNTAILAAHEYRPARTPLDTAAINLAKGVSTAKISFRAYTAIKQILSWPAFLADANIAQLAKYTAPWNWRSSWKWAMENLPNFKKRVESRTVGNEKLDPDELDSKFWGTEFAKWIGRNGMSMNAFVDALTVSIGARAMYETKKEQYLSEGYDEARADKKARFDATTLFNETQQSSEKEFMSTMQADRTVVSVALSVYRNSSFGYQRQLHSALRTLGRLAKKGYKQESIEYMTKQLVRDGLSEDQARDAAEKRYNKALGQAAVRAAVFGFIVEFAWNLGANAIYLLFGDDPDEKKQMLEEDAMKALSGGMVEGLAGGSIISDLLSKFEQGESVYGYDMNTLPIMQDVKNTIAHFGTDPVSAANELVFLGPQIGLGTNPQTFSDAIVAIIDACNGDFETAKEVELLIMRILQVPQSQLDQLMIDEIDMTAGDAKKLSYEEVAQRYVDYKMMRNAPLTGIAYPEELRAKREKSHKTTFKKKYNQRMKLKEQE